jgi:hypothetical protein
LEIAKLVLDKLLSWPAVVGAIAFIFRKDIKALMRRAVTIRFPGGELSTSQAEPTAEAAQKASPDPPGEQILPQNVPPTQGQVTLTQDQFKQLADGLLAANTRAFFWEYAYLDYFLAPFTKLVLYWLDSLKGGLTLPLYHSQFAHVPAHERKAIIDALTGHLLIQLKGNLIEVTPKGHQYIELRRRFWPFLSFPGITAAALGLPGATPG